MSQQLQKLNDLLRAILPANAFYQRKLGSLPEFTRLTDFSSTVPFTTKEELAADHEAFPPYGSTHTFPLGTYHRFHQTSGTRGKPLIWLDDPANWTWILNNWEWVWRGAGVKPGETAFFPFSFGPFLGFWAGFEAATRMGVRAVPGGGLSSEDRLHLLRRSQSTILCCTPTYALRLAEVGEKIGLPVGSLGITKIIVCGEPGGSIPEIRRRIESAWSARVYDHHGMTEIGPVSVSSEHDPDLLLLRHESYFCEVIDPATGQPVAHGETGELVLTTLGRHGSPLLRYRTGDLVRPVPHGDHFALQGGVLNRTDDMVVIRGINIHPSSIDAIVRAFPEIGEYQVEIDQRTALAELRLTVEAAADTAAALAQKLRSTFSLRIPVTAADPGTLPTFEVKAKRWNILR
jgi:phenylacetate-CoA ligase